MKLPVEKLKCGVARLKKQIAAVYLAYLRKDVPWYKKAFLLLILVYAVSPIDFIPDFIPVLGMLDDLVVIPIGIVLAVRMIPESIWEECRAKAEKGVTVQKKYKAMGAALILALWGVLISLIVRCFL